MLLACILRKEQFRRTIRASLPLSLARCSLVDPLFRLGQSRCERIGLLFACSDSFFQRRDLLLLCVEVVRVLKLTLHIVEQVLRVRFETAVQFPRQTRELLQCADCLAQCRDFLKDRVIGIVETA